MPKRLLQRFHIPVLLLPDRQERKRLIKRGTRRRSQKPIVPSKTSLIDAQTSPKRRRISSRFRWLLLWLSIFSMVGLCLTAGALLLMKIPPPIDCKNISPLASDGDRLDCAQKAADSGKLESLVGAITLVQHWQPEHPLYPESQRRIKVWSEAILRLAQQKIRYGGQEEAIAIARKIPVISPLYPEAQAASATWQESLQKAQNTNNQFQQALKSQKWQLAGSLIGELSAFEQSYWTDARIQALMKQMSAEKQAWQQLEDAKDLVKTTNLDELAQAIALVAKINPKTYTKAIAQKSQTTWSRTLVKTAALNYKNQDFPGAIKVLQKIPTGAQLYPEAQDWIKLARAAQASQTKNILSLIDAIAAVRQIQANSPIHKLATAKVTLWESQLQGTTKLEIAKLTASLEQRIALFWAIDYAQKVPPKHPQRLLAQTLIAQWRKEIQRIDNRSVLTQAQKFAGSGTIAQLKRAVQVASTIKLGQPLRPEAQNAIALWTRSIQTIEDQPILDMAKTYAQQQNLTAAISTASTIPPGRALSAEAKSAIAVWVAQVQTAQDRPILEAATALADQGRYDAAIATAAQIPADRALYPQAQAAIAQWNALKTPPPPVEQPMPLTPLPPLPEYSP